MKYVGFPVYSWFQIVDKIWWTDDEDNETNYDEVDDNDDGANYDNNKELFDS